MHYNLIFLFTFLKQQQKLLHKFIYFSDKLEDSNIFIIFTTYLCVHLFYYLLTFYTFKGLFQLFTNN